MAMQINNLRSLTIAVCFIPLLWVFFDIAFDNLGPNQMQALHIRLGDWALRFLWITLAITPVQTVTKWRGMTDYRQLFGLFAFFYASLHVLAYLAVDQVFAWRIIGIDILESSYIWFGLIAYIIIFSLGITSSKAAKKSLGKSWKKLHRFIYIAAGAAMIHYFWQLKGNLAEPLFYLLIIFMLLGFRAVIWFKNKQLSQMMIPKGRASIDTEAD
ncbi:MULTISPECIES: sulfite oxidase heme-binding subunit YedZ [Methylomonas]|uniref:Protein-methionine-sulfoxide reductase heme-binding subunit MsrQ n=2 Tax=Methylomonas TaxID=416 RepID=A0A126T8M4_9GAMM|nr:MULTISPECIES: protein-methionine-sulfoxide reductase heme-binding subunit MsrQ [Methylomonas]AMK78410.1 sulfoxide reductase heme-binding subunit YedZ [Methylomonas denitrificans]OAI04115.1 sulfoxide reductase heme-binding subunit YedZ [Methylomonas methanica]TCV87560.1 sulfoxide reductase heme-binding subunit YedZ [Methylomonas methanica]